MSKIRIIQNAVFSIVVDSLIWSIVSNFINWWTPFYIISIVGSILIAVVLIKLDDGHHSNLHPLLEVES